MTEEKSLEELKIHRDKATSRKNRRIWVLFLVLGLIVISVIGVFIFKAGFTVSQMNVDNVAAGGILSEPYNEPAPQKDPDRINILLLGLRGADDPNGGLLTDTMMILSLKKSTSQVALISIPRDLYMTMPGTVTKNNPDGRKEKINFAYALGEEKKPGAGLVYAKAAVAQVTGLYIDYSVSVNFAALKEIIDILGGIDIHLDKPFIEEQQWVNGGDIGPSWAFSVKTETVRIENASSSSATSTPATTTIQKLVFEIPAGNSHLDANTTLYYMRARYSSNDFDRVNRQQKVLLAIKEKAMTLGILTNPVKLFQIMNSLGKNVRTDMTTADMTNLLSMYPKFEGKDIIHQVFDNGPEGLLYASRSTDGAYILLPAGNNYDRIREKCKNIFNQ